MNNKDAKEYWEYKYNMAKNYSDIHWEADERQVHQEYVEALKIAVNSIKENDDLKRQIDSIKMILSSDCSDERKIMDITSILPSHYSGDCEKVY